MNSDSDRFGVESASVGLSYAKDILNALTDGTPESVRSAGRMMREVSSAPDETTFSVLFVLASVATQRMVVVTSAAPGDSVSDGQ